MDVVVIGDLSHVIIEEPPGWVFSVCDTRQGGANDLPFAVAQLAAMSAQHGHRDIARIAVEYGESEGFIELCVPGRGPHEGA